MRRRSIWSAVWNGMSFIMGTSFNWIVIALTVFLIYAFMLRGFSFGEKMARDTLAERSDDKIELTVEPGETTPSQIAAKLEEKGVIANALLFRLENLLKASDIEYKPGEYTLTANMETSQINAALQGIASSGKDIKITTLEGFSLKNIADYLESKEIISADDFLTACIENSDKFDYDFLQTIPVRDNPLEGYLFPDTYFLPPAPSANAIIDRMLIRFEQIYTSDCEAKAAELGLTMDQVVTVASMIEKEVRVAEDREKMAELIYNRMKQEINLSMTSTVLYVLGIRKDRLTEKDYQVDSPYNTYIYPGLPYGPICNPGKACIEAALNPTSEGYLYFIPGTEGTGNGAHRFYATEEEYNAGLQEKKEKPE